MIFESERIKGIVGRDNVWVKNSRNVERMTLKRSITVVYTVPHCVPPWNGLIVGFDQFVRQAVGQHSDADDHSRPDEQGDGRDGPADVGNEVVFE